MRYKVRLIAVNEATSMYDQTAYLLLSLERRPPSCLSCGASTRVGRKALPARRDRSEYRSAFVRPRHPPTPPTPYPQLEAVHSAAAKAPKRNKCPVQRILSPLPLPIGLWGRRRQTLAPADSNRHLPLPIGLRGPARPRAHIRPVETPQTTSPTTTTVWPTAPLRTG